MSINFDKYASSNALEDLSIYEPNVMLQAVRIAPTDAKLAQLLNLPPAQSLSIQNWLRQRGQDLAFIQLIQVDPGHRKKGLASEVLTTFVRELAEHGLGLIVLKAAALSPEGPEESKLQQWYGRFGFQSVLQTETGALMVYPQREARHCVFTLQQQSLWTDEDHEPGLTAD